MLPGVGVTRVPTGGWLSTVIVWLATVLPWALVAWTRTRSGPWGRLTPVKVKWPLASAVVVPAVNPPEPMASATDWFGLVTPIRLTGSKLVRLAPMGPESVAGSSVNETGGGAAPWRVVTPVIATELVAGGKPIRSKYNVAWVLAGMLDRLTVTSSG